MEILQIDLFPARGQLPETLSAVSEREKDIRYSSRTRLNTDMRLEIDAVKAAFRRLAKKLPADIRDDPDVKLLSDRARESSTTILQLIYKRQPFEGGSKDYEFSRSTMLAHWAAGAHDARLALNHPDWIDRPRKTHGVTVFDLSDDRNHLSKET